VLIVDWDVHHGNGTQNTFWNEPRVLYFSIHEFPFYPGTGGIHETGGPDAPGRNVNVPWPAGMGDAEYVAAFDRVLMPVAAAFAPDLVIVSCGFDAARGDLLGGMDLTEEGYVTMTERVTRLAGGRVVLALEGGYERRAIARAAAGCSGVLLGERLPEDQRAEPELLGARILDEVVRVQRAFWPGL
jgi:acetoin utilization deacetylase AcuC-like enzyme